MADLFDQIMGAAQPSQPPPASAPGQQGGDLFDNIMAAMRPAPTPASADSQQSPAEEPVRAGPLGMPVGGSFRPSASYESDPHGGANIIAENDIKQAQNVGPMDRFQMGLGDPPRALGQVAGRGYEAVTGDPQYRELADRYVTNRERDYNDRRAVAGQDGFDLARLFGSATTTAPLAAAAPAATGPLVGAASGAFTGALGGILTPLPEIDQAGTGFWTEKGKQTGLGALGGGVGGAATGLASRLISPKIPQAARDLRDQGVDLTIGQTMGGGRDASLLGRTARRLEEGSESIPGFGDAIKNRKFEGLDSYNRVAVNQTLDSIGEKLPQDVASGREAVRYMQQKVSAAYDAAVPQMTAAVDATLANDVNAAAASLKNFPAVKQQFLGFMRDEVASKFDPATGTISGQNFKIADSQLGRLAASFKASPDANQQALGNALQSVNKSLMDSARRYSPPEAVAALDAADKAFAMSLRVGDAAGKSGTAARDGIFTPAQLDAAVRGMDPSLRGKAYQRGDALMQDYAAAGAKTMGSVVPDSGTPYRLNSNSALGWLTTVPFGVAGSLAYSKPAQKLATALVAGGNGVREPLATLLQQSAPFASTNGGLLGGQALLPLLLPP
jgi:hypothetical protein